MNIAKKLKHIIRWFAPYGMVRNYGQRLQAEQIKRGKSEKEVSFMDAYKSYVDEDTYCRLAEESPYETIVSIQGFGFSGSGAVVDLLREYESAKVLGFVDVEGSLMEANAECEEVDILRLSGGLFEVEKYLDSNNIFQNDALLHRLIALIEQSSVYGCYQATHPYFYEFVRQISHTYLVQSSIQFYNPHLDYKGNHDILFLKPMSVNAYRELCRKLLNSIFKEIKRSGKEKYLVLDQLVSDCEFDYEKYKQYIPNLKSIVVYRDPRDIYVYAKNSAEKWIPSYDVEEFISWYKTMIKNFDITEESNYFSVRFDELLMGYENQVEKIERYLGLESQSHLNKKKYFDPEVSMKNMGKYLEYSCFDNEFKRIEQELPKLCYTSSNK